MKKILTTTCAAAFVLALTLAGAGAQIYTNALDTKDGWDGPGGTAAGKAWTIDNTVVAPDSTGSWKVAATYSGGGYVDLYTLGSFGTWDFSTNTFSIWFRSSDTNAYLTWRLGNASNSYYAVDLVASTPDTWQQFTRNASDFSGDLSNLTNVNFMQLRFNGDILGSGSADLYVDQMNIIPEPSSLALLALSALGAGGLAWRRRLRGASK